MKDNISIIFTAIIGTFLIILLPLYSILDRQDSMSYNVVLTETTNFVDNIRNNGFLDRETYYNYISALSSTANTYKVSLEAYRKTLIHETDEYGNIIEDSFVEEIELFNTMDILEVLEGETEVNTENSNRKNNVYLFDENDEIYVKVYNTNITAGSIIYNLFSGANYTQVINVSYGGIVNKINWELYHKIQADTTLVPEVVMSVPVNALNSTNIKKIEPNLQFEDIDCSLENLEDYVGETEIEELCKDLIEEQGTNNYTYLYDLTDENNRKIRIAIELRRFYSINAGNTPIRITELKASDFDDSDGIKSDIEKYIIKNYINLNGMYADIDLKLRQKGDYYVFDVILSKVRMSELDYISSFASVTILPGLGQDENGILSIGAETVEIELLDENAINSVTISMPHNWKKLIKTKNLTDSRILDQTVYVNQDLAFVVSYTGINGQTDEAIVEAIEKNLKVHITDAEISDIEIITAKQLNDNYGINMMTNTSGHVIIKLKYVKQNNSKQNYVEILPNWIETNIEDKINVQDDEEHLLYAQGAKSTEYQVLLDDSAPVEPGLQIIGTIGRNNWYTSEVDLNLIPSTSDTIKKSAVVIGGNGNSYIQTNVELGGSGVYLNTISITGAVNKQEQEITKVKLDIDGISHIIAKSYDYVNNVVTLPKKIVKIDRTAPTAPIVEITGEKGENDWYKSNVDINITSGIDATSGFWKTTYRIEGANALAETTGTSYTLTKEGKSTVIATTYDNAGNKTETKVEINIDKAIPPDAKITVIEGKKHSKDTEWYYTDVTLRVTIDASQTVSGLGSLSYRITGSSSVPTTQFQETTKDIKITTNGTHNISVYTYTKAGNFKETKLTVKIDKDEPIAPTLTISGNEGENGWYTSNVEVVVTSNGDEGTSTEKMMTYTIANNGDTSTEREIANNGKIIFSREGEYILKVYSRDVALNKVEIQKTIKVDKTAPTPADFVITGDKGLNDWYTSDVKISYSGEKDDISGIQSVELSIDSITKNTSGTIVTLITKDNAGNQVTKDITIKVDKRKPTSPKLVLPETTGKGIFGTSVYNKDVEINITPGSDDYMFGVDNSVRTTLEITSESDETTILAEIETTKYTITDEGKYLVIARTYDKAGNVSKVMRIIWIDKTKPETPKLLSINGTSIGSSSTKEIVGNSSQVILQMANISAGNNVKVTLINQATHEKIEIDNLEISNSKILISLEKKGTYSIKVSQTNMFGTTSDESTGLYLYKYE